MYVIQNMKWKFLPEVILYNCIIYNILKFIKTMKYSLSTKFVDIYLVWPIILNYIVFFNNLEIKKEYVLVYIRKSPSMHIGAS